MRNAITGILIASVSLLLVSCEKVIDLPLENAEQRYVIEAALTDQPGKAAVFISRSKDFDQDNSFQGVSGAVVTISDNGGIPVALTEGVAGQYDNQSLSGTSGHTYELQVTVNGERFSARSTMPARTNLDSIFLTNEFLFSDFRNTVNAVYMDPAGRGNSYRFIQFVNDRKDEQLQIQNDEYTDGRMVNSKLFFFADDDESVRLIDSGDKVRIEMQCIDPVMYQYWFSLLRSSTGDNNQATPANPVTNMQGGALGYFSAHTSQVKEFTAP